MKEHKPRLLICGVLPPPYFGHSMMYEMLMRSSFVQDFDVCFLNMHFWSYEADKKITLWKIFKLVRYYCQFLYALLFFRPRYILYNISFYKMPFLKDLLFCGTGIMMGARVVIHDHGQYVRELHDALPSWQQKLLRWMLTHSAGSIVMGERVRSAYEGLMDQKKIFVVPGVVEDTQGLDVPPDRPAGACFNVVYFSHMSRSKGIFVAFEAADEILKMRRDVCFTFGGPIENDEVRVGLEALQKQYPERVRYLGYVEGVDQRTAIFRGADIFMFTTLRDVFGLVLLHAMAEGRPVVASREGTIPEIVTDGVTGLLFDKGNAKMCAGQILRLLNDEALRQRMGAAGRKRFEDVFAIDKYGPRMAEVFSQIS
jgi:glycosyltransferase involved in cell wall biosynthesis